MSHVIFVNRNTGQQSHKDPHTDLPRVFYLVHKYSCLYRLLLVIKDRCKQG